MNNHYIKIMECISSSKTEKHFESCQNMVETFQNKFCVKKSEDYSYAKKLVLNMTQKIILERIKLD